MDTVNNLQFVRNLGESTVAARHDLRYAHRATGKLDGLTAIIRKSTVKHKRVPELAAMPAGSPTCLLLKV